MNVIKFVYIMFVISILFSGCRKSESADQSQSDKNGHFNIVTTVGMVGDIVKQVAGEKASVINIIGEGVDPHLYKPTRSDVAEFLNADIIFYAGLSLEGKMTDVLIKIAGEGKRVHAVTELIDESFLLEPSEFAGHYDPHVWMDVNGWMKAVEAVATSLNKFDPENSSYYLSNADRYIKQLSELDAYAVKCITSIPESSRALVAAHDAFNYFGRAYAIDVMGIQGISTESEAGLKDINNLIDLIVKRDVKAVFVETSVASKNVKALIEGAGKKGKSIKIGGTLYSDAMGEPGSYEGTYLGMIDHNVTTITNALGGSAPKHGMLGKLTLNGKR